MSGPAPIEEIHRVLTSVGEAADLDTVRKTVETYLTSFDPPPVYVDVDVEEAPDGVHVVTATIRLLVRQG